MRRDGYDFGTNPKTRTDIEIPQTSKNTLKINERFYRDDSRRNDTYHDICNTQPYFIIYN